VNPGDVIVRAGVRMTSLARTWCDLGTLLNEESLVAAGDNTMWFRRGDDTRLVLADLRDAARSYSGRRGRPTIATSLPLLSDRADSRAESLVRVRMVGAGLPTPEVNLELFDSGGRFLAMPDLSYPGYALTFDYEGDHHRTESTQWEKDIARVPRLEAAGWHHTRLSRADLRDSSEFLDRARRLLVARGWR
jgi:hypothetical protein